MGCFRIGFSLAQFRIFIVSCLRNHGNRLRAQLVQKQTLTSVWRSSVIVTQQIYCSSSKVIISINVVVIIRGVYDVHTKGEGSSLGGRMQTGEGSAPCGHPRRQLEPNNIILSSSHAKKLAFLDENFVFSWNKKWTFLFKIN